jgi:hypothetical protein
MEAVCQLRQTRRRLGEVVCDARPVRRMLVEVLAQRFERGARLVEVAHSGDHVDHRLRCDA